MKPSESRQVLGSRELAGAENLPTFAPDPTISVIVTCYNYGHFLESCLVSLLSQTRPADELIVVNDGSTDLTAQILEKFAGSLHVITTANGGQAAGFNVGFAASRGDIVLFVDADDLLRPEAVETIVSHWSSDFAALTYGLETIDEAGRSTGLHAPSINADRSDNRPRLLATGTFSFPPTSGIAFLRQFLEAVLPIPEARWRISADCYLIRAAALFGRFGHIPQVLGSYRLHGGNNYAFTLDEFPNPVRERANRQDMADSLAGLAQIAERVVDEADDAPVLRQALCDRACRLTGVGSSSRARGAARGAGRDAQPPDFRKSERLRRSRWPVRLPYNQWVDLESAGAPDVKVPRPAGSTKWRDREAEIDFVVDPTPRDLVVTVEIDPGSIRSKMTLTLNGDTVWEGMPGSTLRPRFAIPRSPWAVARRFLLALRWGSGSGEPPHVAGIELSSQPESALPYFDDSGLRPMAEILTDPYNSADWQTGPDGSAAMRGNAAHLRFVTYAERPHALLLDLGPDSSSGWLTVTSEGRSLFTGMVGSAASLSILLPYVRGQATKHDLMLNFDPAVGTDGSGMYIFKIGLQALDSEPATAPLNVGEKALCMPHHPGARLLRSGWAPAPDGEGYYNIRSEAALSLVLPHEAEEITLRLNLEPGLEFTPGMKHIVGVTEGGEWLSVAQLEGPGALDIPLPTLSAGEAANLVVHSAYVSDAAEALGNAALAMIVLKSVELLGTARFSTTSPLFQPRVYSHSFQQLTRQTIATLDQEHGPGHCHELCRLRKDLSNELVGCDDKALLLLTADELGMRALVRLGQSLLDQASERVDVKLLISDESSGESEAHKLRIWLLSMLHCPAYEAPLSPSIVSLPAPLFWHPEALAGYLGRPPQLPNESAHHAYRAFLLTLLGELDVILSREDRESPYFRFAASVLSSLRSTVAIFGSGSLRDLIRLRSRCIERLLLRSGARLAKAYSVRKPRSPIRVGVLVRDVLPNPEGWAVLGMYSSLDRKRFDPVLIRMDKNPGCLDTDTTFAEEICLSRKSSDAAVAAIRALDLDLFLTGCYATDSEKTSAILAHRLAPLQIWHAAVCPTTGGFSSFDIALSCRATEPADANLQYSERLAWIDGPIQCAYAFPPHPPSRSREAVRRELGLDGNALMLVSGAMAHKLSDELLARWAGILSAVPNAMLVLYPFAANWSLDFAADTLRNRVNHHLTGQGLDYLRVTILKTQTLEQVRSLLSAADLYLDSFPYSGATTVCEALASGTPVLTCAGTSLRELTGASWIRAFGLPNLVANSPSEYQDIAGRILKGSELLGEARKQLRKAQAEGKPQFDPMRFGAAFSRALWEIASNGGRNLPSCGQ